MNKIRIFNRDTIRYFAIICMTLDHVAWYFLTFFTPQAQIMHFFGRMTAPIMCFFIAQGYQYTHDLNKYLRRLLIFGFISQIPFFLLNQNELNMMFTLAMGLLSIIIYESQKLKNYIKPILILLLCVISLKADWLCFGPLWVLGFHIFRNSRLKQFLSFSLVWLGYLGYAAYINNTSYCITQLSQNALYCLYTLGSFVGAGIVLFLYNGQKGRFKQSKWIFYVYYPLHLIIIALLLYIK